MQHTQTLGWLRRLVRGYGLAFFVLIAGSILQAVCTVGFALAARGIINAAVGKEKQQTLLWLAVLAGIAVVQLLLRIGCRMLEERVRAKLENKLRQQLFRQLLYKQYAPLTATHSGEWLNRLFNDAKMVTDTVTSLLPNATSLLCRLALAFGVLTWLDLSFAPVFAGAGLLLFAITLGLRGKLKQLHRRVQAADGQVRSFMQERLGGVLVVKAFDCEGDTADAADVRGKYWFGTRMRQRTVSVIANAGLSFLFNAGYVYALGRCAYCLLLGSMDFGTVTSVLQLVGQVQSPFSALSGLMPQYYAMLASADRIREMEDLPDEPRHRLSAAQTAEYTARGTALCLENVTFGYGRDTVLKQAHCRIPVGQFTAVTGASGIGKSTLLSLLIGVFSPQEGEVFLQLQNGERLPLDASARRLFAYVPQGNGLFSGSLRDNLRLAAPDADDEKIAWALHVACAEEFVSALPEGLDTLLTEGGHGLSEGQAQRIALARALVSGAPVLLLDEATSALDPATERQVLQNLRALPNVTVLFITHKTAALSLCDIRLHLQNGNIEQQTV